MDLREAIEMGPRGAMTKDGASVDISDRNQPIIPKVDSVIVMQAGTRRLFSTSQLFAYSLTYMSVWEAMCGNMFFALYNGGPNAFAWGALVAFVGAMSQAASLGEMASILPMAGAQYHWTWHLAPPRAKRFATYIQGWTTWFGYISVLASCCNVAVLLLQSVIELNWPSYDPQGWHTSLMMIAICLFHMLVNMYCMKLIPWIETMAGVLHICLFVVFIVVMAVLGNRHDAEYVFLESNISSGWEKNSYVAWNIGMLTSVWSFIGFDGAIHMSEETRKAKLSVPRAMFWSILTNGILAFVMVVVILVSMGPIEDVLNSATPINTILLQVTGSKAATSAMVIGLFLMGFCATLATVASASRLTWAWARDGGLAAYFAYIHPRYRVPLRAIILTVFIVCLLSLLNISSASYVAFGAITSLCSLALYISYFIAISTMLYARYTYKDNLKLGEWNWGRWGGYINIFALVYTLYMAIFLPFPSTLPVTASNMNYCGPVMVFVLAVTVFLWFAWARTKWSGPNLTIMDFIVANS